MHGAKTLFLLFINAMLIPGGSFVLHRGLMALSEADKSAIGFQNLLSAGQENNKSPAESLSVLHDLLQALLSSSFPTAVADGISEQCKADSIQYVHSIFSNHSIWALQMRESSGKLPVGFFGLGNFRADGLFDECIAIRAPEFGGQYCTVYLKPSLIDPSSIIDSNKPRSNLVSILQVLGPLLSQPDRIEPKVEGADPSVSFLPSISFCLPSSCSAQDLGQAIAQLIGSYAFGNYSIVTVADEEFCFKDAADRSKDFNAADLTVIVILSTLAMIVSIATVHESWRMYKGNPISFKSETLPVKILHCFSFLNNSRKLLSMKPAPSGDNFGCIHGMRFLSMCWVVLGHLFLIGPASFALNRDHLIRDTLNWAMLSITNATVSVDTFFVMSGLLACYLLLRELDRSEGKLNIILLYAHRYLRLTVVYGLVLGFIATLMVYVGIGPNWYNVSKSSQACQAHWWKLLLYINNLFPGEQRVADCMGQTWYLAVDMQLFLVSPLLIYFLWRWKKIGPGILTVLTLATLASNFALYAVYDLPATAIIPRKDLLPSLGPYFDKYYIKPWTRAPPYLIGIGIGWLLYVTRNSYFRLSKVLVACLWTLSTAVALAIIYGVAPYTSQENYPTIPTAVSMTYGPLHRTAWGFVIGWIIFACSRGHGGIINRILSWKGFMPLGRLTYCVYLIHFDYLIVYYSMERRLYYYTFFGQITSYLGLLLSILAIAFLISATVEASFLQLEKLVLSPKKEASQDISKDSERTTPVTKA